MAASPDFIQAQLASLTDEEKSTLQVLLDAGQSHLFNGWPAPGVDDDKKRQLLAQAKTLNEQYPNGLKAYAANARTLLRDAALGVNPYDGWTPAVPTGERFEAGTPEFAAAEVEGMKHVADACFALVAGGLGERLGYNGIKIALPSETITEHSFMELYCRHILALQHHARRSKPDIVLPLAIMTSDDTHKQTVDLLALHNNFGMADGQITIVKQEKVPSLLNNDAHFAQVKGSLYEIETKPHGHGDVHTLLHQAGLVAKWATEGRKWLLFFQDTNGLVFHALPLALAVSAKHGFAINSLSVPRKPGEAVGGICTLKHTDGRTMTLNVEYNQLDPLLRATINKDGDVPDATGFSPFPGNINVLCFDLGVYHRTLQRTSGAIPEFVNPKYKDATKQVFQSPTRLECMMQDFPKLLESSDKVGFTQLERWLSFSAVKNNVADAAKKAAGTGFAECAASGEADLFYFARRVLKQAGVAVDVEGHTRSFCDVPVHCGANVVLDPSVGSTLEEIKLKFRGGANISISSSSTLVVEGSEVFFDNLDVAGTLIIRAVPGAHVTVKSLKVHNSGWQLQEVAQDSGVDQKFLIRGYVVGNKQDARIITFDKPGRFTIDE